MLGHVRVEHGEGCVSRERANAVSRWDALPSFVLMSRIVLGLMSVLLVVMPWSEQYPGLDNFPHGQDAEMALLGFFMLLGLMLLFARSCRRGLGVLLTLFLVFLNLAGSQVTRLAEHGQGSAQATPAGPPIPGGSPGAFNLPLQI